MLTVPAICVYVAYLQRHTKAPTLGHVRRGNRLLRWIRREKTRLSVWFRKLQGPLRLVTLSDSAFKAQDYQGLVMRGCIILLVEAGSIEKSGGSPPAIKTGQEVRCQVLDWHARKHSRVVRSTCAAELLSLIDAVGQGHLIASCLDEALHYRDDCACHTSACTGRRCTPHGNGVSRQLNPGVNVNKGEDKRDEPRGCLLLVAGEHVAARPSCGYAVSRSFQNRP